MTLQVNNGALTDSKASLSALVRDSIAGALPAALQAHAEKVAGWFVADAEKRQHAAAQEGTAGGDAIQHASGGHAANAGVCHPAEALEYETERPDASTAGGERASQEGASADAESGTVGQACGASCAANDA